MKATFLLRNRLPGATFIPRQKQTSRRPLPLSISATPSSSNNSSSSIVHTCQRLSSLHTTRRLPHFQPSTRRNMDAADDLAERFEAQAAVHHQQQQQPPPKGSKGAGGAAGSVQKREKDISRALSRLLRHQATKAGIQLDREGYAPLDKVVSLGFLSLPSWEECCEI